MHQPIKLEEIVTGALVDVYSIVDIGFMRIDC